MERIKDWAAQRSGDSMTIHGRSLDGVARRIGSVIMIRATAGGTVAETRTGKLYLLCPVGAEPPARAEAVRAEAA